MCGIAGLFLSDLSTEERTGVLRRMAGSMVHRGPDDEGFWLADEMGAGLAFRRLSIIDLETGNQPLLNEDESIAVVANGEIYNHRELRRDLENAGHRFRTRSDCEVIVHLYEEHGEEFLRYLNGMFGLAVLDKRRRALLLARDAAGMKHVYWARRKDGLVFASEAQALFASGMLRPAPDWPSLAMYLSFGFIPSPGTPFQGVERLRPGHCLLCSQGRCSEKAYWQPRFRSGDIPRTEDEQAAELEATLRSAVKSHSTADVPVGAFVSGGLDSSLVAVYAAQLSARPLRTFAIVFPENPKLDERRFARLVAEQIGSEHEEVEFRVDDLADILPAVVRAQEEPNVAAPAALIYMLSKLAARGLKVVLSGEGSDELFAGYRWFKVGWSEPLCRIVPRPLANDLKRHVTDERLNRLLRIAGAPDPPAADGEWFRNAGSTRLDGILNPDLPVRRHLDGCVLRAPEAVLASCRDVLQRYLSRDFTTRLPDAILLNGDKTSMAHSLEIRMPFLDRDVVDFALALPSRLKLRGRREKYLLNRLARHLPPRVAARRKQGLAIPIRALNGPRIRAFVTDTLLSGANSAALFDRPALERCLGRLDSQPGWRRSSMWSLLNLKLWWDEFIGRGERS